MHSNKAWHEKLGGRRQAVPDMLEELASSFFSVDMANRYQLEHVLASMGEACGNLELLFFAEYNRYDETPMKLLMRSIAFDRRASYLRLGEKVVEFIGATCVGKEALTAKLLQTEIKVAALLCVGGGPAEKFICINCFSLIHIQILERVTWETIKAALIRCSSTSRHADQFTVKARLATTDQASANFVAEAAIVGSRPPCSPCT